MTLEESRNGIFALKTRRFGNVAEIMIKKIYHLEESNKLEFDKFDPKFKKRIEVKFSTVLKENEHKIKCKIVHLITYYIIYSITFFTFLEHYLYIQSKQKCLFVRYIYNIFKNCCFYIFIV